VKVLLVGDTHGDTKFHIKVMRAARSSNAQAIIQLGDWDLRMRPAFRTPALDWLEEDEDRLYFWLDGNHDNHDYIREVIMHGEVADNPVAHWHERMFYCPRGSVTKLGDTTVMFLGGAYSIDKNRRTPGADWWPGETISVIDAATAVENSNGVDIMFTHDCPNTVWFNNELDKGQYKVDAASQSNRDLLSRIVHAVAPKKLYHGHYHTAYESDVTTSKGFPCQVTGLSANVRHNPHQFIGPIFGDNVMNIDL
jgi:predicted phosphodiesterase